MSEQPEVKAEAVEEVGINEERAALYEKFKKSQEPEVTTEVPSVKEDAGSQPVKTEEVPPTEKGVREGEENKPTTPAEKQKDVPHAALHAERERRKAAEALAKEKDEQIKTLLADLQKLSESKTEEPIEDYEKAILDERNARKALEKKIADLESTHQKRSEWEKAEEVKKVQEALEKKVSDADASLKKAGFPGFSRFKALVAEELAKRVRDGEAPEDVDTPEEWERTYKEKVFPQVQEIFVDEKLKAKEEKKKDANISTGAGGGAPKKDEKEKPWSFDDYMEMRKKRQAA